MAAFDWTTCEGCGERFLFAKRLLPSPWCLACASERGLIRISDSDRWKHDFWLTSVRDVATRLPLWWRWTVWLGYAVSVDATRKFVIYDNVGDE